MKRRGAWVGVDKKEDMAEHEIFQSTVGTQDEINPHSPMQKHRFRGYPGKGLGLERESTFTRRKRPCSLTQGMLQKEGGSQA